MSEWVEYSLEDVAEITSSKRIFYADYVDYGIPFYRSKEIIELYNRSEISNSLYISEQKYLEIKEKYGVPVIGDILLTSVGTLGIPYLVNNSNEFYFKDGNLTWIRKINKNIVLPDFIYCLLNSPLGKNKLDEITIGSTQAALTIAGLKKIKISVPNLNEQLEIVNIIQSISKKINLLHRQNKTLESMAETLFRQWFVEEAQDDWVHGTLKDEFAFTMGQSPKGSSFNEERIGTPMFQGNADFGFRFPKERVYTTEPTRFAQKLDTLISVRAPVGAQNMARSKCCIGRGVAAFRHINNLDWYTYTYFKLRYLMDEIKKFNDEGTVFGSISKSDFEKIEVVIPPASIIYNYEIMVKPLNDRVITNCFQVEKLEKLRDTLLPKLMSGEVRVKYTPEEIKQ